MDCRIDELSRHVAESATELIYRIRSKRVPPTSVDQLSIAAEVTYGDARLVQHESGTIAIDVNGAPVLPVLPELRRIAAAIGVSLLNSAGGTRNTRQLGAEIIATLDAGS